MMTIANMSYGHKTVVLDYDPDNQLPYTVITIDLKNETQTSVQLTSITRAWFLFALEGNYIIAQTEQEKTK